jgi:siroheme synthase (precorrin-2 oxidase/ferrochelatase)
VLIVGAGDVGQQQARRISACDATPIMVARRALRRFSSCEPLINVVDGEY